MAQVRRRARRRDKGARRRGAARATGQGVARGALRDRLASRVSELRDELESTVLSLEAAYEKQTTANQQIATMNEELQANNEELLASADELERSHEEMQLLNREMQGTNLLLERKVRELESANNDISNLLISSDLAVLFLSVDLGIRLFTPSMARLVRLHHRDAGRPLGDLTSPLLGDGLIESCQDVLRTTEQVEAEVPGAGGRWYLRRVLPYQRHDHRVDGVVVTFLDITARKQSEAGTSALLDSIVQHAGEAILSVDGAGVIQSFNPAAEQAFGYAAAEVVGSSLELLLPPIQETLAARSEVTARRKDGGEFPMDLTVSEVRTPRQHMFIVIGRDASARQRVEQDRRQLQTEVLAAASLEQRRIGEQLHDQLGQQLSGTAMLAGSLKNRLAAARPEDAQMAERLVQHIQDAQAEMRRLARGLLPVVVDERGLMVGLEELARSSGTLYGVTCAFRCDTTTLVKDNEVATRLYRIAQESILNAIRHGRAKEVEIRLRADAGGRTILEIRDDGEGVAPVERAGSGLGLRIMRYRAELLGGSLEILPSNPRGTLVRCTLPGDNMDRDHGHRPPENDPKADSDRGRPRRRPRGADAADRR